jgi:hypothetical protein
VSKRWLEATAVGLALVAAPVALAACSSGPSSPSGAGTTTPSGGGTAAPAKAPAAICQQLNGVLSDGPDPNADPVGYALSQILPLRGLHSSDTSLMATVSKLETDDEDLVKANGDDSLAAAAIKKDYEAINSACPGVAP